MKKELINKIKFVMPIINSYSIDEISNLIKISACSSRGFICNCYSECHEYICLSTIQ